MIEIHNIMPITVTVGERLHRYACRIAVTCGENVMKEITVGTRGR